MQIRSWSLFFFLILLVCDPVAQPVSLPDTLISHTRYLVRREFDQNNYPGLAVAVMINDSLVWSEGFGYADVQNGIPVDPSQSLFRIGSVSKSLSATGLGILVERHQYDLDAPIHQYVPDFPEKKWPVSTRQVGQHVAGIRHYKGLEFLSNTNYPSIREALTVFENDTLGFEPGTNYAYSSYGWNLISAAMEQAAKQRFLDFMRDSVFLPAGMTHTYPDDIHNTTLSRVKFYDYLSNENVLSPQVDNSIKWAGGGFLSTAEDLIRFGSAILHYRLINKETTDLLWTRAILSNGKQTNYGIGWTSSEDKKGRKWVGHGGGSVGGSSMFLIYPDHKLIVVALINRSQADAGDIAFDIANQFLN